MAGITTHVLDNLAGRPGAGMRIDFSVFEGGRWKLLKTLVTNADGRTDQPVLSPAEARAGQYELAFYVADFYAPQAGRLPPDALFVDRVAPVRFSVADPQQHYHVPMLCTPWSCATYRGS
jgi:5-hydroxyisourate hydrolase